MGDFLRDLAARTVDEDAVLRPRPASMFEPEPGGTRFAEVELEREDAGTTARERWATGPGESAGEREGSQPGQPGPFARRLTLAPEAGPASAGLAGEPSGGDELRPHRPGPSPAGSLAAGDLQRESAGPAEEVGAPVGEKRAIPAAPASGRGEAARPPPAEPEVGPGQGIRPSSAPGPEPSARDAHEAPERPVPTIAPSRPLSRPPLPESPAAGPPVPGERRVGRPGIPQIASVSRRRRGDAMAPAPGRDLEAARDRLEDGRRPVDAGPARPADPIVRAGIRPAAVDVASDEAPAEARPGSRPPAPDRVAREPAGAEAGPAPGPRSRRTREREPKPPVIRVSIGRVEVRVAAPEAPAEDQGPTRRPGPALSLDDYLARRSRQR